MYDQAATGKQMQQKNAFCSEKPFLSTGTTLQISAANSAATLRATKNATKVKGAAYAR